MQVPPVAFNSEAKFVGIEATLPHFPNQLVGKKLERILSIKASVGCGRDVDKSLDVPVTDKDVRDRSSTFNLGSNRGSTPSLCNPFRTAISHSVVSLWIGLTPFKWLICRFSLSFGRK